MLDHHVSIGDRLDAMTDKMLCTSLRSCGWVCSLYRAFVTIISQQLLVNPLPDSQVWVPACLQRLQSDLAGLNYYEAPA